MDRRYRLALAGVAVGLVSVVAVAGALVLPELDNRDASAAGTDTNDSGDVAVHVADIDVTPRVIEASPESARMQPEVVVEIRDARAEPAYANLTYEDVTLCLYDADGTVLHGEILGTVETGPNAEFVALFTTDVTLDTLPTYVVVDHPDLRDPSPVRTELYEWDAERDRWNLHYDDLGEIQDDFEFPRRSEPGTCG